MVIEKLGTDLYAFAGFSCILFDLACFTCSEIHLSLQVGQVGDDDNDEEVDHGDRAQDDHHQQEEHGKASADPVPSKSLIEVSKVEFSKHHGEGGHPALEGVLEHVAVQAKADHHEGKGKASDHQTHGDHIPVCYKVFYMILKTDRDWIFIPSDTWQSS